MSRTAVRFVLSFILALSLWAGTATVATAQFVLEEAYPDSPLVGPKVAKGAVIWNHGKPPSRGSGSHMLPYYVDELAGSGWDVFRLDRDWSYDSLAFSAQALREKVGELHQRGYEKVVLAGQSYGAWISFIVAGNGPPVHAVIATAPAAFGKHPESKIWRRNAEELYPILERIRGTRVMLFLFDGDDYDPGNRGEVAHRLLERQGVDNLIVAYPEGWLGHGAANWPAFAKRFGHCITAFVEPVRQVDTACDTDPRGIAALPLKLPGDFKLPVASAAPVPTPAVQSAAAQQAAPDALTGIWYGIYTNGREAVLAIDRFDGDRVSAIYAWGRMRRDEEGGQGLNRREGRLAGDELMFVKPGNPTLAARPRRDGRLDLEWTSTDGQTRISAVLSRVN